jgi:DNA-binding LacI/PurR family transcriptional regulator
MAAQNQSTRPRLMIDISPELRYRIKVAAAQNDMSIREYIEQILDQAVPQITTSEQEHRPMTQEAFDRLLQFHEQVKQNHQGQTFEDSTELIRQMREERSKYLAEL